MSDPSSDIPHSIVGEIPDMPSPVGYVVHEVEGKPQQTEGTVFWAWCRVEADRPGYTDVLFTLTDGSTVADPYPKPTPDSPDRPLVLGHVVFKVFC